MLKRPLRLTLTELIFLSLLLGSNLAILTVKGAATEPSSRYFPETGHSVSGKFLQYWENNGGLPIYGYPITDAQNEVDPETGKTFLTQWFERNRFELHPENAGTRYEVLLGLLGKDLQRDALQSDPLFQRAAPKAGANYFPETGHNLEGAFLYYWWANGGLERFGYPISEPRSEGSYETGKMLWTQWFERARFEYHPQNKAPYDVLAGLLGNQIKANPPLKTKQAGLVWQQSAAPELLYQPKVRKVDASGNIYVLSTSLVNNGNNGSTERQVAQRYNSQGQLTLQLDLRDSQEPGELQVAADLTADRQGNLFLLVPGIGTGSARVKVYDPSGKLKTQWQLKEMYSAEHLAVDGLGNTYVSGFWSVNKYDREGKLLATPVNYPTNQFEQLVDGITVNEQNQLYVSYRDNGTPRLNYYDVEGKLQANRAIAVPGVSPDSISYRFVAVDGTGKVYLASEYGKFIASFSAQGVYLATISEAGATEGSLNSLGGLAVDQQGNLWVSTLDRPYLLKFDPNGHFISRIGEAPKESYKCASGLVYLDGNIYFADPYLGAIFRYDPTGKLTAKSVLANSGRIRGLFTNGNSSRNGKSDQSQNLYVWQDTFLYRYDPALQPKGTVASDLSQFVVTLGINGQEQVYPVTTNTKGLVYLANTPFRTASSPIFDSAGNLYLIASTDISTADYFLGLFNTPHLFKFKPGQGQLQLLAQLGKQGSGDSEFSTGSGLAFDPQDNLYLVDPNLGRTQQFDKNGKLLAKWSDQRLVGAKLIQVDGAGNVYVISNCNLLKLKLN